MNIANQVRELLIDFANEEGISLEREFETPEKFKQFVLSLAIKTLADAGIPIKEAFDAVLGDGSFSDLAGEVWDSMTYQQTELF